MNYIGPEEGEGFAIYKDGQKVAEGKKKTASAKTTGDGMIVAGRLFTDTKSYYSSVQLDEMLLFNRVLTAEEANGIYNLWVNQSINMLW